MPLIVSGKVVRGTQAASGKKHWCSEGGTIHMQRRFFTSAGVNLRNIHSGTINVSLAPFEFSIQEADNYVPAVCWDPTSNPENFSFVRCLILSDSQWHKGYLYYPHPETKIGTFPGHHITEILTAYLPHICYGTQVQVKFPDGKIRVQLASLCS